MVAPEPVPPLLNIEPDGLAISSVPKSKASNMPSSHHVQLLGAARVFSAMIAANLAPDGLAEVTDTPAHFVDLCLSNAICRKRPFYSDWNDFDGKFIPLEPKGMNSTLNEAVCGQLTRGLWVIGLCWCGPMPSVVWRSGDVRSRWMRRLANLPAVHRTR